jgi:hypothetical protein
VQQAERDHRNEQQQQQQQQAGHGQQPASQG